uniref:Uncharacterized protein n=1 Tax=Monopterus albus TaxID=43700 RepID=A0A3Q3JGQ1_MONAL
MHTLWALRESFRCAVLKNNDADFTEVAEQVVKLLMYDHKEQLPRVPVLLMIDDFDEMEKVYDLQQLIERKCTEKNIHSKSAEVIVLNCMRSESSDPTETTEDTVIIGNNLSEKEQKLFEEKLVEIEKIHKNAETFYGFMIMKKNFKSEYVQGVARNTLKSFNINQKHAQLLAVLVLLSVYCKGASLSISLCEEFLGLQPKPVCGTAKVEDGFGKFSTLIARCQVEGKVVFTAVKMIHSSIAQHCLSELTTTHSVKKADITDLLLTTNKLYESTQGKDKLLQDVHHVLVKRNLSTEEESQFSPLIQDITKETPGQEEMVLINASKRFEKDAVIFQLLARYYYLKKKDFLEAKHWAQKAKELSKDSSYIADTSAQVHKHELKNAIAKYKEQHISPDKLAMFLGMAQSAVDAFKETQRIAKKESVQRLQDKRDNYPFNTSGLLGEIQVGVLIIEMLEKTPVFSSDNVRHDIMSQVLSGDVNLQDVEKNDQRHSKHKSYYAILRSFEDVLYNLRHRMKVNFDLLDNFYVNLGSRFGMKDSREQVAQYELSRCFKQYANLFCKTASLKNKIVSTLFKLYQARQFLEMQKADTYCGILNFLSNNIPTEIMEKIARQYDFLCNYNPDVLTKINFIYANVVLSRIKLESPHIKQYPKVLDVLCQVLREQIPLSANLPLHFIAVMLLWPQQYHPECTRLGRCISQMRTAYHTVMKEMRNGKRPVVHFFLGKKQGYEKLVPLGEIKRLIKPEEFAYMWENGKIWKEKKVHDLLCRVTGEVKNNFILADTCIQGLKLPVTPMFQSQIGGYAEGSKVSFFTGFSVNGPYLLKVIKRI